MYSQLLYKANGYKIRSIALVPIGTGRRRRLPIDISARQSVKASLDWPRLVIINT